MAQTPRGLLTTHAVVVAGIAVGQTGSRETIEPSLASLREANVGVGRLTAVIYVAQVDTGNGPVQSAARVCAGLRVREHSVPALDVVEDGCGVPSSIAVGCSILAQRGGAVLVVTDGAALVLVGVEPVIPRAEQAGGGRQSAELNLDVDGPHAAVERVLATVDAALPIVAVVPGGLRLLPGRRFAGVSLEAGSSASIRGLLDAREAGFGEVALVTEGARGRAAAVVCHLGDHAHAGQRQ